MRMRRGSYFAASLASLAPDDWPRLGTFGIRRARTVYPRSEFGMLDAHDHHAHRVLPPPPSWHAILILLSLRTPSTMAHAHTVSLSVSIYSQSSKPRHPLPDVNQTRVLHAYGFLDYAPAQGMIVIRRVTPSYVFNQFLSS